MAQIGRSPIATQRWGRPSMPATWSLHARTFTRCLLYAPSFGGRVLRSLRARMWQMVRIFDHEGPGDTSWPRRWPATPTLRSAMCSARQAEARKRPAHPEQRTRRRKVGHAPLNRRRARTVLRAERRVMHVRLHHTCGCAISERSGCRTDGVEIQTRGM
eukprot:5821743-Pleurochrysis_carterae.AAC.1